jgi:hypothetical protein
MPYPIAGTSTEASESMKHDASQPSPPLPKPGLLLDLEQLLEIVIEFCERLSRRLGNAEVQQIVCEMRAGRITSQSTEATVDFFRRPVQINVLQRARY